MLIDKGCRILVPSQISWLVLCLLYILQLSSQSCREWSGRPSLICRTFVALDWTWKLNDITNKSRQLSDKEPLQPRSKERSHSSTDVSRLPCKSECFDNVIKLINLVWMLVWRMERMMKIVRKVLFLVAKLSTQEQCFFPDGWGASGS